jgi:hypothetical protein
MQKMSFHEEFLGGKNKKDLVKLHELMAIKNIKILMEYD